MSPSDSRRRAATMSAGTPGFGVMTFAGEAALAAAPLCERPATPAMIAVASAGGTDAMLIPSEGLSPLLHAARRRATRTAEIGRRLGTMGPWQRPFHARWRWSRGSNRLHALR